MSDQDVASAIASASAGLSAQCGSTPKITHEHVYQHNQDNLSRSCGSGRRAWASRCGVEDGKLFFDAPKLDADSGLEFVVRSSSPRAARATS
jgi:hypothetical protein